MSSSADESQQSKTSDITLPDGRVVGNCSEEYRNYCEANWVISNLPDLIDRRKKYKYLITKRMYLDDIKRIRGQKAYESLRTEMLKLWKR